MRSRRRGQRGKHYEVGDPHRRRPPRRDHAGIMHLRRPALAGTYRRPAGVEISLYSAAQSGLGDFLYDPQSSCSTTTWSAQSGAYQGTPGSSAPPNARLGGLSHDRARASSPSGEIACVPHLGTDPCVAAISISAIVTERHLQLRRYRRRESPHRRTNRRQAAAGIMTRVRGDQRSAKQGNRRSSSIFSSATARRDRAISPAAMLA
jgi:hypothetical protein